MTVYVDNARIPARVGTIEGRWSHLTADTKPELHAFARQLGLRRSWFQDKPRGLWHYDVTDGLRIRAVALGAREIDWRDRGPWTRPGREGAPAGASPAPARRVAAPELPPGFAPGTGICCECAGEGTAEEALAHGRASGHAVIARPVVTS